ncbi:MAG: alpha/beta hydrolase [Planctomycetota bacterium]
MTTAVEEIPLATESECSRSVRRAPLYLQSRGRSLFAWLHRPNHPNLGGDQFEQPRHGVVVCLPLGFEQLHAHRGIRHLCDRLAQNNLLTLRFDWDGTGDSTGNDTDAERLSHWLDNVRDSVRWMKEHSGCDHISVIGVRAGALLASLALENIEIDNLILWAPISAGRSFVRELNVIDMMSETRPTEVATEGSIEAAGFRITGETAAELSKVALTKTKPNCRRMFVAGRDDSPADTKLFDHFVSLGIPVEQQSLPGIAELLVEPHKAQIPSQAIHGIVDWLTHQASLNAPVYGGDNPRRDVVPVAESHFIEAGIGIREVPCRISEFPNLFGILSEPESPVAEELPLIIVLNSGSAYRIGPGRMNVEMTRRFASLGFRSLRLDFCGLGDSIAATTAMENDSYASSVFHDIEITLEWVRKQFGVRRIVLMGLCSGAYASFQSAAQCRDPALVECVLINPLTYYWCDGMTLENAPTLELIREHYYMNSAFQPSKWLKLLSGRSSIGFAGAFRLARQRLQSILRNKKHRSHPENVQSPHVSHPTCDDLAADLKNAAAANRQVSMFFSTTDPGYSILTCKAGAQARRMVRRQQLSFTFLDDADHTFSRHSARNRLIESLCRHLIKRYSK